MGGLLEEISVHFIGFCSWKRNITVELQSSNVDILTDLNMDHILNSYNVKIAYVQGNELHTQVKFETSLTTPAPKLHGASFLLSFFFFFCNNIVNFAPRQVFHLTKCTSCVRAIYGCWRPLNVTKAMHRISLMKSCNCISHWAAP